MAAGFTGPIYCSEASALLLPLVLDGAVKVGFTRDERLVHGIIAKLREQIVPLTYRQWHTVIAGSPGLRLRRRPAGHILGCACAKLDATEGRNTRRLVFSGDLGAPYKPLLPVPQPPRCCRRGGHRMHVWRPCPPRLQDPPGVPANPV